MRLWRMLAVAPVALLAACHAPGQAYLIALPDGGEGYTIHANSGPFQAGKISEADVVGAYMRDRPHLCPNGYDLVNVRNVQPQNPSLVIVDAVVRCRAAQ